MRVHALSSARTGKPASTPWAALKRPNASGRPLEVHLRRPLEATFGHDFRQVRIHDDDQSRASAEAHDARAYTIADDIVFGPGAWAPSTSAGRALLTHELTHVVQQRSSGPMLQRKKKGTPATPAPAKTSLSPGQKVRMHFDGQDLFVFVDEHEQFRFSAQSGKPIRLSEKDAAACGADVRTDTYMNDRRFVGVQDAGPIPEGTYTLAPSTIQRFTTGETVGLMGESLLPGLFHGVPGVHPGDWGSGRVALIPRPGTLRQGPCGDVTKRSGFFLHGGYFAGSAGCIDIGSHFTELADLLEGHPGAVTVTVRYEHPPPSVGYFTGASGAIGYKRADLLHTPTLRLGTEFGPAGTLGVASVAHDEILQWAGGAVTAGMHVDVSMSDKESFVRMGLTGGTNFRILGGLYGRLFVGPTWTLAGRGAGATQLEAGAGLTYDLGRVQLEALYDVLQPASENERVQRALIGVGFRFK